MPYGTPLRIDSRIAARCSRFQSLTPESERMCGRKKRLSPPFTAGYTALHWRASHSGGSMGEHVRIVQGQTVQLATLERNLHQNGHGLHDARWILAFARESRRAPLFASFCRRNGKPGPARGIRDL